MKFQSYNKELERATAQLMDAFNDITITRVDRETNETLNIRVGCVNGTRSRIMKSLENRDRTIELPIIAISMKNFSRDS